MAFLLKLWTCLCCDSRLLCTPPHADISVHGIITTGKAVFNNVHWNVEVTQMPTLVVGQKIGSPPPPPPMTQNFSGGCNCSTTCSVGGCGGRQDWGPTKSFYQPLWASQVVLFLPIKAQRDSLKITRSDSTAL